MVRGDRAARLGNDRRMRQVIFFASITDRPNDVVRILVQPVVNGTIRLRARPFVVHAQTAAHIEALNVHAELVQFHIETRRFTHAGRDITDIRHLRTEVEVQQLDAVQTTALTQDFY